MELAKADVMTKPSVKNAQEHSMDDGINDTILALRRILGLMYVRKLLYTDFQHKEDQYEELDTLIDLYSTPMGMNDLLPKGSGYEIAQSWRRVGSQLRQAMGANVVRI